MIADRLKTPQHNLHSSQAGDPGHCAFHADSSLSWRRLARFLAITILASFVLNEIWEMAQMSAGDFGRGLHGRWNTYVTVAVWGLTCAALVEHAALASGRWSYTDRMPVVSILGAGLWPLLQMTILPPLTFFCAQWWAGRSATKEVF